jgi:hypothetical protein
MIPGTPLERFERHYIPEPNSGCWLWLGSVDRRSGYGFFHWGYMAEHTGHMVKAHVAAYRLFKGDPGGLCVCHHCDVRTCVNPDHLFLGTHQANTDDRVYKGRPTTKTGEQHPRATLTAEIVQAIRADPRATRFIVADYGIHASTVRKIKRREAWKHLP